MHMHRQSTQTVRTNLSPRTAYLNLSPFPHCYTCCFSVSHFHIIAVSVSLISIMGIWGGWCWGLSYNSKLYTRQEMKDLDNLEETVISPFAMIPRTWQEGFT